MAFGKGKGMVSGKGVDGKGFKGGGKNGGFVTTPMQYTGKKGFKNGK